VRGEVIEDFAPVGFVDLGHALFFDHPDEQLVPPRARKALLRDDAFGMAGGAGVIGGLDARRVEQDAERIRAIRVGPCARV